MCHVGQSGADASAFLLTGHAFCKPSDCPLDTLQQLPVSLSLKLVEAGCSARDAFSETLPDAQARHSGF